MRGWRKLHPPSGEARERDIARSIAGVYLRRGKITKMPCLVCESASSEMHHEDYEKPLEVVWLCREHHLAWHAAERNVARETFSVWAAREKVTC